MNTQTETLINELRAQSVSIQQRKMLAITDDEKAEAIKTVICAYFNKEWARVDSDSRKLSDVLCKVLIAYFIKNNTSYTLKMIGNVFQGKNEKGRHHSTIIHYISIVSDRMSYDKKFTSQVREIETAINHEIEC